MKPAQALRSNVVLPEQERPRATAAQHLFASPKRVGRALAPNPHDVFRCQSKRRQGQRLGRVRRRDQEDLAGGDAGQGRCKQAQLANTGLLQEQFGQGAFRPAAARQLGREAWVASVSAASVGAGQLGRAPERRM